MYSHRELISRCIMSASLFKGGIFRKDKIKEQNEIDTKLKQQVIFLFNFCELNKIHFTSIMVACLVPLKICNLVSHGIFK